MQTSLLTKKEVAAELRVSVRFVDVQVQRRALAAVKLGRAIRFRREDVKHFVDGRRLHAVVK